MNLEVLSPFSREIIGQITLHNENDLEKMLRKAENIFKTKLPKYKRIEILENLIKLLEPLKSDFAHQIALEGGKPLKDAVIEVERAIKGIKIAIAEILTMRGSEMPMEISASSLNRKAFTFLEPIGIIAAISAFNHPLNLIIHQVIPAIATGCPVIIKPDLKTPFSCINLVKLIYKAGLPEEQCQVLLCNNELASLFASNKRIAMLNFIGSSKIGFMLKSKISPYAKCVLEHGGAAPTIVDANANIDYIIPLIAKASFYHAGQVCVSTQRIYLHHSIFDEFCEKFCAYTKTLITGDPLSLTTDIGPLIHPSSIRRIESLLKETTGKIILGGKKLENNLFEPTIILNAGINDKVTIEEIFGPAVCLYSFEKIEEAVTLANNCSFSFQGSIFSDSMKNINYAIENLNAKTVLINDHSAFRIDSMPFGGQKESGFGTGGIPYTMRDMLNEKMFIVNNS